MEILSFRNYSLNRRKSEIYYKQKTLELEPQVYSILELLITRHGELVSRDDIIEAVWDGRVMSNNAIDNRIRAARAAIGDTGKRQRFIKTYPNRGYKFIGRVNVVDEETLLAKPENEVQEKTTRKDLLFSKIFAPAKLTAGAVAAIFGLYAFSQSTILSNVNTPSSVESSDDQSVYKLALSEDANPLPRVVVLPFETIGDSSTYGFLPEVFKSQFNNVITAIDGITVVSLSSGIELKNDQRDYKSIGDLFAIDYAIASTLSSYGDDYKLNVSLIRTADGVILDNQAYDLKVSKVSKGLGDLSTVIASKVTLMTANKLNLSVESLPPSWESYDFYSKIKEAEAIVAPRDYESVKKATQILREAIKEEPSYLPAYSQQHQYLSWLFSYLIGDYGALLKEQAELALKMKDISPNAPETLYINSFTDSTIGGIMKTSVGEFDPNDPVSVSSYILKKDPDHVLAAKALAYMSGFNNDQIETVKAYENLLRLVPTYNWALGAYTEALFCNNEIYKAQTILQRLKEWHPDHRFSMTAQIRVSHALGDYETAIIALNHLLEDGLLSHDETKLVRSLFFDLGHPELALPHVRFEPAKAHVYAMMDNKEASLEMAAVIAKFYTSVRARMIVERDYIPEDYSVHSIYARVGHPDGVTKANACRLDFLARDTYVLKKTSSEKFDLLLPLLTDYFEDKDPVSLRTQQEYLGLIGLHILQGELDKAIDVLDIAMDKGFLLIGSFKEPHLRELTSHPGFPERFDRMQKSADLLIEKYYQN